MPGTINDPSNRTLRREILQHGIGEFCTELQKHSAPLKLADDQPAIGRFFPTTCQTKQTADGNLVVALSGDGYGWTNLSKKVTFDMSGTIEYDQDFQLDGSTMYAYFRTKQITKSDFRTRAIENTIANLVNQITPVGDNFGKQLLSSELQKGFTVIRDKDGNADFGLGVVDTGKRPLKPWDVHGANRLTYENTRSEVHQNQRDFIGPIWIEDDGRAIWATATLDGVDALDVIVLGKADGEAAVASYIQNGTAQPMTGNPVFSDVMQNRRAMVEVDPAREGRLLHGVRQHPHRGPRLTAGEPARRSRRDDHLRGSNRRQIVSCTPRSARCSCRSSSRYQRRRTWSCCR